MSLQNKHRDYFRNLYQGRNLKLVEIFQCILKVKFYLKEAFPGFFYGNLNLHNPIVTISLNPKWDDDKKEEQGNCFDGWLDKCMKGFMNYPSDKAMHAIWKNLVKVIAPESEREGISLREILSKNVINLDWCYYYSKSFPTLRDKDLQLGLSKHFDDNLLQILEWLKPRVIFIHGKSFKVWFDSNCSERTEELTLRHGEKSYKVHSGVLRDTNIPVIYQDWFINRGNKKENLDEVRRLLYSKINATNA